MEYKVLDRSNSTDVARLAAGLINEIIERTRVKHFDVNIPLVEKLCGKFMDQGQYVVVGAIDNDRVVGFGALCESHSLYAEGTFGIVQEFYILPEYRSKSIGKDLLAKIIEYGKSKQWVRLELCTPPVPEFDRTVSFYKENGFEITGGYKMKYVIA
nr:GCN5-related N-acetyltransferase [uncultured bacterium]BAJ06878.1 GCN5-related N-acetyltransferase [uncultured bacterium]